MCYSVFETVFTFVYMPEYTATLKQTATNAIIGCNVQLFIQFIISIDTEERCSLFKKMFF